MPNQIIGIDKGEGKSWYLPMVEEVFPRREYVPPNRFLSQLKNAFNNDNESEACQDGIEEQKELQIRSMNDYRDQVIEPFIHKLVAEATRRAKVAEMEEIKAIIRKELKQAHEDHAEAEGTKMELPSTAQIVLLMNLDEMINSRIQQYGTKE